MNEIISFDSLSEFLADPKPNAHEKIIRKEESIEVLRKGTRGNGLAMILLRQTYTTKEVAQIYKVCEQTVYNHINKTRKAFSE